MHTLTNDDNSRPVMVALNGLTSGMQVKYDGGDIVTIAPVLISYLLFQQAFVQGMLANSSK